MLNPGISVRILTDLYRFAGRAQHGKPLGSSIEQSNGVYASEKRNKNSEVEDVHLCLSEFREIRQPAKPMAQKAPECSLETQKLFKYVEHFMKNSDKIVKTPEE